MKNQLAAENPRAVIGGNQPPLAEQLDEEITPLREQADHLVEVAKTAVIIDDTSAAKVIDLCGLMQGLETNLDAARKRRGEPFYEQWKAVNTAYAPHIETLKAVRLQTLQPMLNAYRAKREAEAAAARRQAEAEQRQREAEAAKLQQEAEQKIAAGKSGVGDRLAAMQAQEAAAAAARRAEAIRPQPVRGTLGRLATKREIGFKIVDIRKLLGWMLRQPVLEAAVYEEVRAIMGPWLRTAGVRAIEHGEVEIPGLEIGIHETAAIRR